MELTNSVRLAGQGTPSIRQSLPSAPASPRVAVHDVTSSFDIDVEDLSLDSHADTAGASPAEQLHHPGFCPLCFPLRSLTTPMRVAADQKI